LIRELVLLVFEQILEISVSLEGFTTSITKLCYYGKVVFTLLTSVTLNQGIKILQTTQYTNQGGSCLCRQFVDTLLEKIFFWCVCWEGSEIHRNWTGLWTFCWGCCYIYILSKM